MPLKTVDCVLLAAGASSRMGEPKLLMPLGEGTILEAVLANHLASSLSAICVVVPGWIPGFARLSCGAGSGQAGADQAAGGRVAFLKMDAPCPMSLSLKSGWAWICENRRPGGVMISLADKPLVSSATIDAVVSAYRATWRPICVPTHRGSWGHPVVLNPALGAEVMDLDDDRGAFEILDRHRGEIEEVAVGSDEVVFDVDSAEDLAALRARWKARG